MAVFCDVDKQHFPLDSLKSVVTFFRQQLENNSEPNLALLSIIIGAVENSLTVNRFVTNETEKIDGRLKSSAAFPVIELSTVDTLYTKFVTHVKSLVDLTKFPKDYANRTVVKLVSDVVWGYLTRTYYKDKAHIQTIFSLLTGKKLDCFGVALSTVAACQVLGYKDVHLSLSEDHAWVIFGEGGSETAEVTWHGKGNEDKRGQSIHTGVEDKSWLYLNGHSVVCSRSMEVAAMVTAINPTINLTTDSTELIALQKELLWMMYDKGHIARYPMALGNLGELEDVHATPGRPSALSLYQESIDCTRNFYDNKHVYPYMYMSHYHYRNKNYWDALRFWAEASGVIKSFNYNREDEEIYKKFFEIANDLIPEMVKVASLPYEYHRRGAMLRDPVCYANLLRFYDGICAWEENSSTPVLHIGWAQQFVFSMSKFHNNVRRTIDLHSEGKEDEESDSEEDDEDENGNTSERRRRKRLHSTDHSGHKTQLPADQVDEDAQSPESHDSGVEIDSRVRLNGGDETHSTLKGDRTDQQPNMAALAQACGESILNPDFLISGGEAFSSTGVASTVAVVNNPTTNAPDIKVDFKEFLSSKSNGSPFVGMTMDSMLKADSPADMMMSRPLNTPPSVTSMDSAETTVEKAVVAPPPPLLYLHSEKMKALRKLFCAEKINSSAIKLQMTAQTNVDFKNVGKRETHSVHTRKKSRRE